MGCIPHYSLEQDLFLSLVISSLPHLDWRNKINHVCTKGANQSETEESTWYNNTLPDAGEEVGTFVVDDPDDVESVVIVEVGGWGKVSLRQTTSKDPGAKQYLFPPKSSTLELSLNFKY